MKKEEDNIEEFKEIAKEILKQQITKEEIQKLAKKWAILKAEIRKQHGIKTTEEEINQLTNNHIRRIKTLRKNLGLDTPD